MAGPREGTGGTGRLGTGPLFDWSSENGGAFLGGSVF